jgi:hypothetical protein
MDNLISRQQAIDAVRKLYIQHPKITNDIAYDTAIDQAHDALVNLPSAQPEIIYCKDCKHFIRDDIEEYAPYGFYNTYFHAFCDKHWDREQGEYIDVKLDDFCSFAERRKK